MSTVGYICTKHDRYFKLDHCPLCESRDLAASPTILIKDKWVPGVYEHIDTQPLKIESREHLKHECDKRGVYAKALTKSKSTGKGITWR